MRWILSLVLRCRHKHYTWPRGRDVKTVTCLDCGMVLKYDWREMRVIERKEK